LASFLVFRPNPDFRRKYEREFVELYYKRLLAGGRVKPETYSFEQCWKEYVYEGAARCAWYCPQMCLGMTQRNMGQEYLDRFTAFLKDHNITAETMEMQI